MANSKQLQLLVGDVPLSGRLWVSDRPNAAAITAVLVTGSGVDSSRLQLHAERLAEAGYLALVMDHLPNAPEDRSALVDAAAQQLADQHSVDRVHIGVFNLGANSGDNFEIRQWRWQPPHPDATSW
ncbi:hypothetical protein AB0J14_06225 [Micromonospora arborensis]|uniref:hypothetical protein n=1 Tax=Micromonospora arborensis TaxID=2116518 RepID=UPI0033E3F66B